MTKEPYHLGRLEQHEAALALFPRPSGEVLVEEPLVRLQGLPFHQQESILLLCELVLSVGL